MGEKRVQQELKVLRKNNEKLKIDCNAHIVDNQSLKGTVQARKFKKFHVQKKKTIRRRYLILLLWLCFEPCCIDSWNKTFGWTLLL